MCLTVKHYLDIYRDRKLMQDRGITNPPDSIKIWVSDLIHELEKLDPSEKIDLRKTSSGGVQFILVRTGGIIAQRKE